MGAPRALNIAALTRPLRLAPAVSTRRIPVALPRASSPHTLIPQIRRQSTMSRLAERSGVTARSPAFTQLVVKSMQELFPEELADRTWDNVGLLLDNVQTPDQPPTQPKVLLTNDLTYPVAEEAIALGASVIISYHPIIFRPLKALTCADPQQATLLRLASARVAVYCPHTALDASPRGINAWLTSIVESASGPTSPTARRALKPTAAPVEDNEGAGYGMETALGGSVPAAAIVKALGERLGGFRYLSVVEPPGVDVKTADVSSVAVCAGSGGDILRGSAAEMWVTGEMSHHEALAAAQKGRIVVTTYHSNTERRFLKERLGGLLEKALRRKMTGAEVFVSQEDKDPFRVVDLQDL